MARKHRTTAAYRKAFSQLNANQRAAVEAIDGPVLVLAGPGTGKTQLLATRIGNILDQTDSFPHNILCLTYTDSGVNAMRDRLRKLIGPDAYRVHINTFHSFCSQIIRNNSLYFGGKDWEQATDLERKEMREKILRKLPADHVLQQGYSVHKEHFMPHLNSLFKEMKLENWSLQTIEEAAKTFIDDLPNRDEYYAKRPSKNYKKGELRTGDIAVWQERMDRLTAAAKLLPVYEKMKDNLGRYDYEDMILWTIEAFKKYPNLLRRYQEQYLYVLVDEFQDTNGAQFDLLNLLIDYWDEPNVFAVGDDDQAIFGFQGARLQNLTDFYKRYQSGIRVIPLTQNYRSSSSILAAATDLIDINEQRLNKSLGIPKELIASGAYKDEKLKPKAIEFASPVHERQWLLREIRKHLDDGVPADEIGIIYRNHKQSIPIIQLLRAEGIPFTTIKEEDILTMIPIKQLLTFVKYLHLEVKQPYAGDVLLYRLMNTSFFGLPFADLQKLALWRAQQESSVNWRDLIADRAVLEQVFSESQQVENFISFSEKLNTYFGKWHNLPPRQMIQSLINESGMLAFFMEHPQQDYWMSVLTTFMREVEQYTRRNPQASTYELHQYFQSMMEQGVPLSLNVPPKENKGVQLMTAHKAKGLEFEVVFIFEFTESKWKRKGNSNKFKFPDTLTYESKENEIEEGRRLAYVAMTRAKRMLYMSYPSTKEDGKPEQAAQYLTEVIKGGNVDFAVAEMVDEAAIREVQYLSLLEEKEAHFRDLENPEALKSLVENHKMSTSSLASYLNCPLQFFYQHILKIPELTSPTGIYGTAMHKAVQLYWEAYLLMKEPKKPGTAEELVEYFEQEMVAQKHRLPKADYEMLLARGKTLLPGFLEARLPEWELDKDFRLEYNFVHCEHEGVPITGRVDRIDFVSLGEVNIVDYKTSNFKNDKFYRPTEKNPEGGNYWRQLVFYKLLFDNSNLVTFNVNTCGIEYMEPEKDGSYSTKHLKLKADDVQLLSPILKETWEKIQNLEFFDGCQEDDCIWCQVHADRSLPIHTIGEDLESLDDI